VTVRLRAVLDTNVFASAARTPRGVCGRILSTAFAGHWTMVVSEQLLDELAEVLHRPWLSDSLAEGEGADVSEHLR